jgi:nucleoside-diphosphate kinase
MQQTLAIIKPRAFKENLTGPILKSMYDNGFSVLAIKTIKMTRDQAKAFYEVHSEKPFFDILVDFMTSGPVVVIALEKENAVSDLRDLLGSTDPTEAKKGTIREMYGQTKTKNAVHGADSAENAKREIGFFFSESELVG